MSELLTLENLALAGVAILAAVGWTLDRILKRLEAISDTLVHIENKLNK